MTTLQAGLVGSGPWATTIHAPGLAAHEGVRFSHLWARNVEAGEDLARAFGVELCSSYDELLAAVDVVSLCVPPSVQASLAVSARERGKLALLEKPVADSPATARAVADAGSPDVAASVNYSLLLDDSVQAWVEAAAVHDWVSARVVTTNDVLLTDSPFSASPWRRAENAGLWDLGPHSISFLATVLGPIAAVRAESTDGIITVSCDHVSGQRSEAVCSIASESSETSFEFVDADGRSEAPAFSFDAARAYANALTVLLTGPATLCQRVVADLGFSAQVVAVIAAATTSLAEAGRVVRVDDPA